MATIKIRQIRSSIDMPERQKRTLKALGIKKLHKIVHHEATAQIMGMVNKVKHLIEVVE